MAPNPKLELTWITEENQPRRQPWLRIEFAEDPRREDSPLRCYDITLDVCPGPRCGCLSIRCQCAPAAANLLPPAPRSAPVFVFDLKNKSLTQTAEVADHAEAQRLGEILHAELTAADQQRLRDWYLAEKLVLIQTTPTDQIDIKGLPDAEDNVMIPFAEVFPLGLALNFRWNDEDWDVSEQYCVQPGCSCKETVLSFLKLRDAAGVLTSEIKNPPTLRYNYQTEVFQPVASGAAGSPSLASLQAALKRLHANLNAQLELRHLIMQSLYLRHYREQTVSHARSLSGGLQAVRAQRVGRNDPCPCGSGRKYKHCCLRKSSQA